MGDFFFPIDELKRLIGTPAAPVIYDVRRREAYDDGARILPAARWRDHRQAEAWWSEGAPPSTIVLYCVHGHQVSQSAAAALRSRGVDARVLEGGIEGWCAAGGPTLLKAALPEAGRDGPCRWVLRTGPTLGDLAMAWFLRRFVEPDAELVLVAPDQVGAAAVELDDAALDHAGPDGHGARPGLDTLIARFDLRHRALERLAGIVRDAENETPGPAPEAAGLRAATLGIVAAAPDDRAALDAGTDLLDAFYAWSQANGGRS